MKLPAAKLLYVGFHFPAEAFSQAVWLYFRFPLSLRMVEEMLAARSIIVSHETVWRWELKFGQEFANRIRRRLSCAGNKWYLDEVAIKIAGVKHWRGVAWIRLEWCSTCWSRSGPVSRPHPCLPGQNAQLRGHYVSDRR